MIEAGLYIYVFKTLMLNLQNEIQSVPFKRVF